MNQKVKQQHLWFLHKHKKVYIWLFIKAGIRIRIRNTALNYLRSLHVWVLLNIRCAVQAIDEFGGNMYCLTVIGYPRIQRENPRK
jgi:hypothetical protein